ncbi:MAG: hypothetical protein QXL17_07075 [Candidatus Thermoplasmatota archaeon]
MVQSLPHKKHHCSIITASEIAQYAYCPMAWYLKKCGYKPTSVSLEQGKKIHASLEDTIFTVRESMQLIYRYILLGIIFLGICCSIFLMTW